jgi:hypothetical protein
MDARYLAQSARRRWLTSTIPQSIRANDMFVVRYDGDGMRTRLSQSHGRRDISFNVLLNERFGGGTQFWDRHQQAPFGHVQPDVRANTWHYNTLLNRRISISEVRDAHHSCGNSYQCRSIRLTDAQSE